MEECRKEPGSEFRYVFLSLINNLKSALDLYKFVDDCTLSECLPAGCSSIMQQEIINLQTWSSINKMNINIKKTKEMILGPARERPPMGLQLNAKTIDRVTVYKLLGLHVTDELKWQAHVSAICSKASKRLHFLRLLKRASMSIADLTHYYETIIRPIMEYACVVWHTSLTKGQNEQLERIQRRALRIIYGGDNDGRRQALSTMRPLSDRRDQLCRKFFKKLLEPTSCLHQLLPIARDDDVTERLRRAKRYLAPRTRTELFKKSAIVYALNNYL